MPDLPQNIQLSAQIEDVQSLKDYVIDALTQIFDAFNNRANSERLTFIMPGDTAPVALPGIAQNGVYILRLNNLHHQAPAACFAVAKSDVALEGQVESLVTSPGSGLYSNVSYSVTWPSNSAPTIALSQNCPPFQLNVNVI